MHYGTAVARTGQQWMQRVFSWMFFGVLMTGIIAYFLSTNPNTVAYLTHNKGLFWGILIGELVLVFALSAMIHRISPFAATLGFFTYAGLNGVSMTLILSYFSLGTIYSAFIIAAGMFGLFSIYGYVTKRDLSKIGSIATMFLLGIILASVVNIFFLKSGLMSLVISYVLVGLFCVITAFDVQKIKQLGNSDFDDRTADKMAIIGALALYIDFIAIFQNLLFILNDD